MHRVNVLLGLDAESLQRWEGDPTSRWVFRTTAKRAFDLAMAILLTVVTLPIVVVLAAISAVVLREWPFFVQERVGRQGRPIPFVKVRTLPSARINAYELKANWTEADLPAVMRAMRRLHLDELPQLWLVVSGHLSLVGPRPKMPDEVEPVPLEYSQARIAVPQGCTCLWQIGRDTDRLPSDSPQYDYWYLFQGGLRLDLWILTWTALQMLGIGTPKTIDDVPGWARSRGWAQLEPSADPVETPVQAPVELPTMGRSLPLAG